MGKACFSRRNLDVVEAVGKICDGISSGFGKDGVELRDVEFSFENGLDIKIKGVLCKDGTVKLSVKTSWVESRVKEDSNKES